VHLSFREFQVQAWAGDVMVRGGGAAGPAQLIRHQAPGEETRHVTIPLHIYFDYRLHYMHALRSSQANIRNMTKLFENNIYNAQ
jgi:hypothetical protein